MNYLLVEILLRLAKVLSAALLGAVVVSVGTFALILVGGGAALYGDAVGIPLANGLVIAVMVSAVGPISGGFFNPAITVAFAITRRITLDLAGWYLAVQFSAAALAALLLRWLLPVDARNGIHLGAPLLHAGISAGKGVAIATSGRTHANSVTNSQRPLATTASTASISAPM